MDATEAAVEAEVEQAVCRGDDLEAARPTSVIFIATSLSTNA